MKKYTCDSPILLTPVTAYSNYGSDGYHDHRVGIYRSLSIAHKDAVEHPNGWGSDTVKSENFFIDEEGNLYEIFSCGRFKDVEREEKEEILDSIKKKLTDVELEFLTKKFDVK